MQLEKDMHNFEQIFTENRPLPNFGEMFTGETAQRAGAL
jgi:hypothetical protein